MPTIQDLAALAEVAYSDTDTQVSSWRKAAGIPGAKGLSGFSGAAFKGPGGALVIAFRGSEGFGKDFIRDWVVNDLVGIGTKILPIAQTNHAAEFAEGAIGAHGKRGKTVYIVGHSLGGALAQIVAGRRTGTIGVTFNAPGIRDHLFARFQSWDNESNVLNLRRDGDPVSKIGKHVGCKPITFGDPGLPPAKATMVKVMQAVTEGLFIGLKSGVPAVAFATAATAGAVAGLKIFGEPHTMGAVLDGLKSSPLRRRRPESLLA